MSYVFEITRSKSYNYNGSWRVFCGFLNSSASSGWVGGGGGGGAGSKKHEIYTAIFLLPANEVWGKVIFLHLSVILFTGGGGGGAGIWEGTPGRYTPSHPRAGTPPSNACWDTVNKRAIRILLECILVYDLFLEPGGGHGLLGPPPLDPLLLNFDFPNASFHFRSY